MENAKQKSLNIALLGYGKMGKEIEQLAIAAGHQISIIIDNEEDWNLKGKDLPFADVAIDFSMPKTAISNIERCFVAKVPIVIGTTGWYTDFERISQHCIKEKQSLFYATNFSLGVNIFSAINKKLAHIMNRFPEYEIGISETHHTQKLDAPSGTAISLAKDIIDQLDNKNSWELDEKTKSLDANAIPIKAYRIENVPGTHEIVYSSQVDTIKISHEAINRKGFAKGAILAAEWLYNKQGIFTMNDLLAL